ncbi:MAG: hypothetical protein IJC16_03675 [Rikenellaceae bacterium]|nr:hypothetical protein [Rikenellaceae bacterium]
MHALTLAFVIFTLLTTFAAGAVMIRGLRFVKRSRHRRNLFLSRLNRRLESPLDTHISVIVAGSGSIPDLERWLSLDYANYELIYICDFARIPDIHELLLRYEMIKSSTHGPSELIYEQVRNIYSSRIRRYNRFTLVDRREEALHHIFNCGANISNHEYVICFEERTRLDPDALQRLLLEMSRSPHGSLYALRCFHTDRMSASVPQRLDRKIDMLCHGAGLETPEAYGRFRYVSVLFKRETLIKAGGFHADCCFDAELFRRMTTMVEESQGAIHQERTVLIPEVLAYSDVKHLASCRKYGISTRSVLLKACFLVVIAGLICFSAYYAVTADWGGLRLMGCLFIYLYCCAVVAALLGLQVVEPVQGKSGSILFRHTLAGVLLYPFHYVYRTLRIKNFVNP